MSNIGHSLGNFGRYQCPNEGQARIAEYLDLAKGNSMRKSAQNHSHPFFDPLYGASKTDPFQNNGPIMSRDTKKIPTKIVWSFKGSPIESSPGTIQNRTNYQL